MNYLSQIGCLLLMGIAMCACQNPLKDVELRFIEPLPTTVELRLKPEGGVLPKQLTVRVVGQDAGEVVTPLNTTKFKVSEDGRLYLSLRSSATPTANKPIRFTVVGTADDAYAVVFPVVLSGRNQRIFGEDLFREQTKAPIVQTTGSSDATGALKAILTTQTPSANPGGSTTQFTIPAGVQLKDPLGAVVAGTINVRMKQLDTRSVAQFAGSGILFQPLTAAGQPSPTQQFGTVAGGVRILAYNDDYQLIKSFTKPARLTFRLIPQLINPQKNRPVQAGDLISLFSYDATVGRWQQELAGTVVRNARNELEYVAEVTHLSDWVAAFTNSICESGPVFKISSPIPPGNLLYRCQVIDAVTNLPVPNTSGNTDFYSTITNGRTLQLYFLPTGSKVKLKVYDSASPTVVTSAAVDGCAATQVPLDLSSFSTPKNLPVPVTVALQFPCKSLNEAKLPTKAIYAQFRESGTTNWYDLPVLRYEPGKTEFSIVTYDVKIGKTYDIQAGASPGNYTVSQPNQLIDSNKWVIRIKTKEYCN